MFSDVDDAFNWIESFTNLEKSTKDLKRKYRPERMSVLLDYFGNPQNSFKSIHLAGSKGKGSTSALLSAALTEGGFRTGLYTSPHVLHYKERIQINGKELADSEYMETAAFIRSHLSADLPGGTEPTTFELLTLMGFLLFQKHKCEWCVIETGLGGRLDATNAVMPEAVLLTPIEKEHTQWLGNDLLSIAAEKAGIIKPGKPVFSAPQHPEVENLFRQRAGELASSFTILSDIIEKIESDITVSGTRFNISYKKGRASLSGELSLIGQIQAWNTALALEALEAILPEVKTAVWLKGFRKAVLPARMEILSTAPLIVCDGAHTPRSVSMAMTTFSELTRDCDRTTLLFACQDDKEIEEIAPLLSDHFSRIIITTPGYFKKSNPFRIYEVFY